jgi:hypothetical protein
MKQPVITLLYVTRWSPWETTCGYTKLSGGRSWNYQFLKMATLLQSCTKLEMRSVIRFLDAEGAKQVEIYTRMLAKYGASCVSKTKVYPEWIQKFKNGVQSFEESPRSGQAHRFATPEWLRKLVVSYEKIAALQLVKLHWRWRRFTRTSPQIGWRGKEGGAWLAGTATKRLILPRNLCHSGTLEEVCRTWWGLH